MKCSLPGLASCGPEGSGEVFCPKSGACMGWKASAANTFMVLVSSAHEGLVPHLPLGNEIVAQAPLGALP
mgnify:FL=1